MSGIEWTDVTWNPVTGCTKVSPGCANCYIERTPPFRMAGRRFERGRIPVELHPERLDQPLRWRKPRRLFVCSLADLWHDDVPVEFILAVWAIMEAAPQHTYQLLTKRPERMRVLLAALPTPIEAPQPLYERRPIPGWPGYYADTEGTVWSDRRGNLRRLSPGVTSRWGHAHVTLHAGPGMPPQQVKVHRLILATFDREPNEGEETRHLDGDASNNRISNLRWGSCAENSEDRTRHGNAVTAPRLTIRQVAEVRVSSLRGEPHREIGRRFGISHTQVARIVSGESWGFKVLPNVWLGVSVENQRWADERIPLLLETPAAVRFLSCEPLLGPLGAMDISGIHWVIVGGESGPGARPIEADWIRDIRKQCRRQGVPFFFKQWGGVQKKRNGRVLDGQTWDEYPKT